MKAQSYRDQRLKLTKRRKLGRSTSGVTIVEALVGMLIAALVSGIFLDLFGKLLQTNAASQNEIYANVVSQEMMDTVKGLGFDHIADNLGTFTLLTNRTATSLPGPAVRPDPLLLDLVNRKWNSKVDSSKFQAGNTVTYTAGIAPGFSLASNGQPEAIKVSIAVTWSDGVKAFGHTVTTSTILTRTGVHQWTP
jgi:type II secretory pathway pseudopilin PulG